jgi:hypothetical protein
MGIQVPAHQVARPISADPFLSGSLVNPALYAEIVPATARASSPWRLLPRSGFAERSVQRAAGSAVAGELALAAPALIEVLHHHGDARECVARGRKNLRQRQPALRGQLNLRVLVIDECRRPCGRTRTPRSSPNRRTM